MEENKKSKISGFMLKGVEVVVGCLFLLGIAGLARQVGRCYKSNQDCRKAMQYTDTLYHKHHYCINTTFEELDSAENVNLTKVKDGKTPYKGAFLWDYDNDGNKDLIYDPNGKMMSGYCKIKYGNKDGTFDSAERVENVGDAFYAILKTLP